MESSRSPWHQAANCRTAASRTASGEGADLARLLGQVDEAVGHQQSPRRVLPPHEGLDAGDPPRGEVQLGLVVQHQLAPGVGLAQLPRQLEAVAAVEVAICGVHRPAPVIALGVVHGDVGPLDERVGIVAVVGSESDPDAGLDPQAHPVDRNRLRQRWTCWAALVATSTV